MINSTDLLLLMLAGLVEDVEWITSERESGGDMIIKCRHCGGVLIEEPSEYGPPILKCLQCGRIPAPVERDRTASNHPLRGLQSQR